MLTGIRRRAFVAGGALWGCLMNVGGVVRADSAAIPLATTLLRAVAYDANLKARAGATLVLAVLYRPTSSASRRDREDLIRAFKALESTSVQGLAFKALSLGVTDAAGLEREAAAAGVSIFYLCAGLDEDLPVIKQVSRKLKIRTTCGKEALVEKGVSLAVDTDARPTLIVNLKESREEGASFSSSLLRLAKIIK
jgi:hypothetical protein